MLLIVSEVQSSKVDVVRRLIFVLVREGHRRIDVSFAAGESFVEVRLCLGDVGDSAEGASGSSTKRDTFRSNRNRDGGRAVFEGSLWSVVGIRAVFEGSLWSVVGTVCSRCQWSQGWSVMHG